VNELKTKMRPPLPSDEDPIELEADDSDLAIERPLHYLAKAELWRIPCCAPLLDAFTGIGSKNSFQFELLRRRKQMRQQPRARKASWISARRS